jgi:glyoxylase-like metal-dependent hydrolase (beta-lactamase superfamily II)
MVRLESQTVLMLGDVTYTIAMMRERRLPALLWSADHTMRSWERIESLEDEHDATLLCSHELDFEALVRQGPDEWYE